VFISLYRCWWFPFSVFSLVFVLIDKIYWTLKTELHWVSKNLKFREHSAACHIFNSLLGVWISLAFDMFCRKHCTEDIQSHVILQYNNQMNGIWSNDRYSWVHCQGFWKDLGSITWITGGQRIFLTTCLSLPWPLPVKRKLLIF